MQRVEAPWTEEQVQQLNDWQINGHFHGFTCVNRGDGNHKTTSDLGILVATKDGWICPSCDYTQNWAFDRMMAGPLDLTSVLKRSK